MAALSYCQRHGARLVFLSSYLYGHPRHLPIGESAPLVATNPYALSKKLAEESCQFFAAACGVAVTVLRPFNVFGHGQSDAFLVPSLIRQVVSGDVLRVKDLVPKRDYVYVRDVVDAIAMATRSHEGYRVLNIGAGRSYSVAELIETVQAVWGSDLPVVSDDERRADEIMDTVADITQAEQVLGWKPRFTLRQGLEEMFEHSRLSLA
jgi:nucleoside-diphosphate-sugar epimerase